MNLDKINHRNWFGHLTYENCSEVGQHIYEFLKQVKTYNFITYGPYDRLDCDADQYLTNGTSGSPYSFYDYAERDYKGRGFNFCTSWGIFGLSCYSGEPQDKSPYIVFDYRKLRIDQLNGAGEPLK